MRSPSVLRIVNDAPSATSSGGKWFVGSLTQTLPPIVPRLRIWTSAIVAATSARIGRATSTSDDAISWVFVTIAPISSAALVGGERDRPQLGQIGEIDEHIGRGGPGLHHVDERLAACEGTCPVVLGEEGDRLLDGCRTRVLDLS